MLSRGFLFPIIIKYLNKMSKKHRKHYIIELSLDELRERANQKDGNVPFEYQVGACYEMDVATIGEIAHIKNLIKKGLLSPCEKKALFKRLKDCKLDQAERKAYGRAIEKLRKSLLQ